MSLNNIASLYANRSLFDSSLVYLKRAHSIRPNDLFIIENIAAVSFLNKEYDQAEAFARKGLQLDPSAAKSQGVLRDLERTRK
jgi:tetratricopeptide (TPR) repeat protein